MPLSSAFLTALCLTLALPALPATAQTPQNDGFQRRNGQMQVLRNGQLRPMQSDAHLPTGAVVTKDGFVLTPDGRRTELGEGQGCNLRGQVVSIQETGSGALALGAAPSARRARSPEGPGVERVREVLEELLDGPPRPGNLPDKHAREFAKKAEEYAREQRKQEEEWRREAHKHWEEQHREEGKKGKKKWKKGKGWDD